LGGTEFRSLMPFDVNVTSRIGSIVGRAGSNPTLGWLDCV